MRHILLASLVTTGLFSAPAWAQAPGNPRVLTLSFDPDGRVNLKAQSVTIREILAEWARQCGCYVVNAQTIGGGPIPVPFQFDHASQRQVLESLLRQVSGYTLTPRREGSTSLSLYETIHITPSSLASQSTYVAPVMAPTPDDEIPPVVPSPLRVDPNAGQQPAAQQTPGTPQQPGAQQPPAAQQQGGTQQQTPRVGAGVVVPIVGVGGPPVGPTPGSVSQTPRPAGSPAAPAPSAPGTPTGR